MASATSVVTITTIISIIVVVEGRRHRGLASRKQQDASIHTNNYPFFTCDTIFPLISEGR